MNLRRCALAGFMSTLGFFPILGFSVATAGTVVFDFNNGTAFDNVGSGVSMVADNTDVGGTDTITMNSVDIRAPEYVEDPANPGSYILSGNTLSAANGDGVTTNIAGTSINAIGVNNLSINDGQYEAAGGPAGSNVESANFNLDEEWVIDFDQDVIVSKFDFSSLSAGDSFEVTVEDVVTSFGFPDAGSGDDYEDPFGGLVIPAGKDVTFRAIGVMGDLNIRITEIQVDTVVPEPTSLALVATMLLAAGLVNRCRES